MSFGRNPHVPKAQVAEQKAADAGDSAARAQAHRDAARLWERAAEREPAGKRRTEYEENAAKNRRLADSSSDDVVEPTERTEAPVARVPSHLLN